MFLFLVIGQNELVKSSIPHAITGLIDI